MKHPKIYIAALSGIGLLAFLLFVAMHFPLTRLFPEEELKVKLVDLNRSSLARGDIYFDASQLQGPDLMRATWKWCPGYQPLSWCMQIESTDLNFAGTVSVGWGSGRLQEASMHFASLRTFGIAPALADLKIDVQVENMVIEDFRCPLRTLQKLAANAKVREFTLLGEPMGNVDISAFSTGDALRASINGDRIQGKLESLDRNGFSAEFMLQPPEAYEGLLKRYANPNSEGVYEWQLSGQLPCMIGAV